MKTNQQQTEFETAVKPLIKYLAENHNPHVSVTVTSNSAELMESNMCFNTDNFLVD